MADTADKAPERKLQLEHYRDMQRRQIQTECLLASPAVLEDVVSIQVCIDARVSCPVYFS